MRGGDHKAILNVGAAECNDRARVTGDEIVALGSEGLGIALGELDIACHQKLSSDITNGVICRFGLGNKFFKIGKSIQGRSPHSYFYYILQLLERKVKQTLEKYKFLV